MCIPPLLVTVEIIPTDAKCHCPMIHKKTMTLQTRLLINVGHNCNDFCSSLPEGNKYSREKLRPTRIKTLFQPEQRIILHTSGLFNSDLNFFRPYLEKDGNP